MVSAFFRFPFLNKILDNGAVWGYNSYWESDFVYTDKAPNAESVAAINDTDCRSYDSFEDLMKHIDETEAEDFNYTDWRQSQPWVNVPLSEAINSAVTYVRNNPAVIPKNVAVI
jgi:hypothetical protein